MELMISRQALGLLLALALGVLTGLLYDLVRPFRRRGGAVLAVLMDLLFSLAAGICAFIYAMGASSGRLGLWDLFMTLMGFMLYMHFFSDRVYKLLDFFVGSACGITGCFFSKIKKFVNSAKFNFHIVRK